MIEDGWSRWRKTINHQEEGKSKTRRIWLGPLEDRTRIKLPDTRGS